MISCDLHQLRFEEGKEKIITKLNQCIIEKDYSIEIIHGYHGHVFKDYIQDIRFIQEMEEEGFYFKTMDISQNQGSTILTLDI